VAEGARTFLFADLKGSMELLADRDPEEARRILDPVLEHLMEAVHRIDPLPPESAEELPGTLIATDPGLEPLKRRLITQTQGNPFFLEESVRTRQRDNLRQAQTEAESLGNQRRLGRAFAYLANYYVQIGDHGPALECAPPGRDRLAP
jgi:hypothetical protein